MRALGDRAGEGWLRFVLLVLEKTFFFAFELSQTVD